MAKVEEGGGSVFKGLRCLIIKVKKSFLILDSCACMQNFAEVLPSSSGSFLSETTDYWGVGGSPMVDALLASLQLPRSQRCVLTLVAVGRNGKSTGSGVRQTWRWLLLTF